MKTQAEKGEVFRALHGPGKAFIIPNPWDIGTARLLAGLGFKALATTSAGYAFSIGQKRQYSREGGDDGPYRRNRVSNRLACERRS